MYSVEKVPLPLALVFWACVFECVRQGVGFQCAPCGNCTLPQNCPGGFTLDVCNCCQVCARVENQSCGGTFNILGTCDAGLYCVSKISNNLIGVSQNEEGTCQPQFTGSTPSVSPTGCEDVKCAVALSCSQDSHRVEVVTQVPRECCPTPTPCQCKPCGYHRPDCTPSQLLRMVQRGENIPGRCCDIYECVDREVACVDVQCPPDPLSDITCPPDSYPMPTLITHDGCCFQHQGCECLSKDRCRPPSCPLGTKVKIVEQAKDEPGHCCDEMVCEPDNTTTCMYNDRLRMNGETWTGDNCTECKCKGGLTMCRRKQCPETIECGWTETPPGECCPVCQGCKAEEGTFHQEGLIWMEDECTMCRCLNGQIFCETQLCDVHCLRPKKKPGECCASCEDDETLIPKHCPNQLLSNCSIHCPNGLITDEAGCPTCQCKPSCELSCPYGYLTDVEGNDLCECRRRNYCPPLGNCQKRCRHGYKLGANGCQICQCLKCPDLSRCWIKCSRGLKQDQQGCTICQCIDHTTTTEAAPTVSPTPAEKSCMSTDGQGHSPGATWWDGCRLCFCLHGVELCALITCPVPLCSHPILREGACCHSCPGEQIGTLPSISPHCPAQQGAVQDNELWQLDACTRCVCHNGAILCEEERCPPLLCHHPVKMPGRCCPQCADEGSVLPTRGLVPGKGCRTLQGVNYSDGEVWQTSPCQSCACSDGQVHCFSQTCPMLSCNETVLRKGQCCPTCDTEGGEGVCVEEGHIYTSGQHWMRNVCTHCMCLQGQQQCMQIPCPQHSHCDQLVKFPGQCCHICLNGSTTIPPIPFEKSTEGMSGTVPALPEKKSNLQVLIAVLVTILILLLAVVIILVAVVLWQRHHRQQEVLYKNNGQPVIDNRAKIPLTFSVKPPLPLFQNNKKLENDKYEVCDEKAKLHDNIRAADVTLEKPAKLESQLDSTGYTDTKKTDLDESIDHCCVVGNKTTFTEPAHCDSDNLDSTKSLLMKLEEETCREPVSSSQRYSVGPPESHALLGIEIPDAIDPNNVRKSV